MERWCEEALLGVLGGKKGIHGAASERVYVCDAVSEFSIGSDEEQKRRKKVYLRTSLGTFFRDDNSGVQVVGACHGRFSGGLGVV